MRRISQTVTDEQQKLILQVLLAIGVFLKAGISKDSTNSRDKFIDKCREVRKCLMESLTEVCLQFKIVIIFLKFLSAFSARSLNAKEVQQLLSISVECYLDYVRTPNTEEQIAVAPLSVLRMIAAFCKIPS